MCVVCIYVCMYVGVVFILPLTKLHLKDADEFADDDDDDGASLVCVNIS